MTIEPDKEAEIIRCFFVEKWGIHTIARQLGIHHYTVRRVIDENGIPTAPKIRPSLIDPYVPFLLETLEKYPKLSAQRLFQMACERGYPGKISHFRQHVQRLRPKPKAEAFLRLNTLPGEQAQMDWGHFGNVTVGRATRPLMAFVMVLSYSRRLFLRFYLDQRLGSFLNGHRLAFEAFQGVPKVLLYDNLKCAVLERQGAAIRFNPTLLALAAHYRFEPRPVAVARGNEKGRVERGIRYIRDNFFAARNWSDIDDLNHQAQQWAEGAACDRRCPGREVSVRQAFADEQALLLALPQTPFEDQDCEPVRVGKTPYVRFDRNDYSVPHTLVRQLLTVRACVHWVRVYNATALVAEHSRSYDRGAVIENPQHLQALRDHKRAARRHSHQSALIAAIPAIETLLEQAAVKGYPLGPLVQQLMNLLAQYGRYELAAAVSEALARESVHANSVRHILQQRQDARHEKPKAPLNLTREQARTIVFTPPSLQAYADLTSEDITDD